MLAHHADVHVCGSFGLSPLHMAVTNGHLEVSCVLLDQNVVINSQTDNGSTPLHNALEYGVNGHQEVVCLLLDHNADVNVCSSIRVTALYLAATRGHLKVACILLEYSQSKSSG